MLQDDRCIFAELKSQWLLGLDSKVVEFCSLGLRHSDLFSESSLEAKDK